MLMTHAAWVLVVTFAMAITYEFYRATIKAGTSRHDSMRTFLQGLAVYAVAAAVIAALFLHLPGATWAGFAFSVAIIFVSIFFYNPRIMLERQPGLIDWIEDMVFTGLLFVAAAQLLYQVGGWTLQPVP